MESLGKWKIVFKTLSNINRLKIIRLLDGNKIRTVSDLSDKLDISIQATSNHLSILSNLNIVLSKGKNNNVYYTLNSKMPKEFKRVINLTN